MSSKTPEGIDRSILDMTKDEWVRREMERVGASTEGEYHRYLLDKARPEKESREYLEMLSAVPLSRFPGRDSEEQVGDSDCLLAEMDDRPDMKFGIVRVVLRNFVSGLMAGEQFTKSETRFLSLLLLRLSHSPKALRELGIKQTKQRPTRDYQIAEEYLWLRECGVKSQDAQLLLIRKWSESESNIKRLIHGPRRERAKEILLRVREWAATKPKLCEGYRITTRSTWRTFALREADGGINPDARAAADEIERLTAGIVGAGERP